MELAIFAQYAMMWWRLLERTKICVLIGLRMLFIILAYGGSEGISPLKVLPLSENAVRQQAGKGIGIDREMERNVQKNYMEGQLYPYVIRKGEKEILKRNVCNGVEYLTFPSLEETGAVNHLFSTRLGGVSEGIFSSMNLSYTRGDKKEAVDENFQRIAGIMGGMVSDFVLSDQTHTTNIREDRKSTRLNSSH